MAFARWLIAVLVLGWGAGALIALLVGVASGQPKPTPRRPAAPRAPHVEAWCSGAYSPRKGSNFGPCPGVGIRPGQAVQAPGEGSSGASGTGSGGSGGSGGGGTAGGGSTGQGGGHR